AQGVAHGKERVLLNIVQASQLTAPAGVLAKLELDARKLERELLRQGIELDLGGRGSGHQRLAVGQRQGVAAIRSLLDTHVNQSGHVLDQLVALIPQGLGVALTGLDMRDALVEQGDVLGQTVELDNDRHTLAAQTVELGLDGGVQDRKSTRLNSSHVKTSYAVFCLKK